MQVPLSIVNGTIYGTDGKATTLKGVNWCAAQLSIICLDISCNRDFPCREHLHTCWVLPVNLVLENSRFNLLKH